jgi:hypothetical protein
MGKTSWSEYLKESGLTEVRVSAGLVWLNMDSSERLLQAQYIASLWIAWKMKNEWAVGRLVPDTVCIHRYGDRNVATQKRSKYTLYLQELRVVPLRYPVKTTKGVTGKQLPAELSCCLCL